MRRRARKVPHIFAAMAWGEISSPENIAKLVASAPTAFAWMATRDQPTMIEWLSLLPIPIQFGIYWVVTWFIAILLHALFKSFFGERREGRWSSESRFEYNEPKFLTIVNVTEEMFEKPYEFDLDEIPIGAFVQCRVDCSTAFRDIEFLINGFGGIPPNRPQNFGKTLSSEFRVLKRNKGYFMIRGRFLPHPFTARISILHFDLR